MAQLYPQKNPGRIKARRHQLTLAKAKWPDAPPAPTGTQTSHLWLALHLPFLPLEALGCQHKNWPTAVYTQGNREQQIVTANPTAQNSGIHTNMSLSAARALVPSLQAIQQSIELEKTYLRQLAIQAGHWTPDITLLEDGLLLNIAGSIRLFGGIPSLVDQIQIWIFKIAINPCIAVMPTAASAILCGRSGKTLIVNSKKDIRPAINKLPSTHLITDIKGRRLLTQIGARTIGDLLRLPRDGLARRFTPHLITQLDQLVGDASDPQIIFKPALKFSEQFALDAAVSNMTLLQPLAYQLLEKLCHYLHKKHAQAEEMQWQLTNDRDEIYNIPVLLTKPNRELISLNELSRLAFENTQIKAPITAIMLQVNRFSVFTPSSKDLFENRTKSGDESNSIVEKLRNRLGKNAVHGLRVRADHRPEKAWDRCDPGQIGAALFGGARPLWLLETPKSIRVSNGQLFFGNQTLSIQQSRERICSGWWDGQTVRRDYYFAETASIKLWIFRDLDSGSWHLHGIF